MEALGIVPHFLRSKGVRAAAATCILGSAAGCSDSKPVWEVGITCKSNTRPVVIGHDYNYDNHQMTLNVTCRGEIGETAPEGAITTAGPGLKGDIGTGPNNFLLSFPYQNSARGVTTMGVERNQGSSILRFDSVYDIGAISITSAANK